MGEQPVLIYDADCAFCRLWVGRWRKRTGDRVEYRPATESVRTLALELPTGEKYEGAKAVCRLFREIPGRAWMFSAYEHVPGFAPIAELAYRVVSSCRECAYRFTKPFIREE